MEVITTLELHSLKELIVLRKTIQDRMNLLQAAEDTMPYVRAEAIEYLTLGQILVRLPEPSTLTPQVCTQESTGYPVDPFGGAPFLD